MRAKSSKTTLLPKISQIYSAGPDSICITTNIDWKTIKLNEEVSIKQKNDES